MISKQTRSSTGRSFRHDYFPAYYYHPGALDFTFPRKLEITQQPLLPCWVDLAGYAALILDLNSDRDDDACYSALSCR